MTRGYLLSVSESGNSNRYCSVSPWALPNLLELNLDDDWEKACVTVKQQMKSMNNSFSVFTVIYCLRIDFDGNNRINLLKIFNKQVSARFAVLRALCVPFSMHFSDSSYFKERKVPLDH